MKLKRRNFLLFLADDTSAMPLARTSLYTLCILLTRREKFTLSFTPLAAQTLAQTNPFIAFQPTKDPILLNSDIASHHMERCSSYEVVDNLLLLGDEPAAGSFSHPDNLLVESIIHLWLVTHMSGGKSSFFGNHLIWLIPSHGVKAGKAFFPIEPECDTTSSCFIPDPQTIVSIQSLKLAIDLMFHPSLVGLLFNVSVIGVEITDNSCQLLWLNLSKYK